MGSDIRPTPSGWTQVSADQFRPSLGQIPEVRVAGGCRTTDNRPPRPAFLCEPSIFRPDGHSDPTDASPRDFLALLAASLTLTIQSSCELIAGELPRTFTDRAAVDARVAELEVLFADRRAVLAAHDGDATVPMAVLERHGWLAVEEARLDALNAPDDWTRAKARAVAKASERGATWLEKLGVSPKPSPA